MEAKFELRRNCWTLSKTTERTPPSKQPHEQQQAEKSMPVMRASRPSAKQKIGDTLYERLKGEHGKLAGKIVGILLEGLAREQLLFLCESPDDLAQMVAEAGSNGQMPTLSDLDIISCFADSC